MSNKIYDELDKQIIFKLENNLILENTTKRITKLTENKLELLNLVDIYKYSYNNATSNITIYRDHINKISHYLSSYNINSNNLLKFKNELNKQLK